MLHRSYNRQATPTEKLNVLRSYLETNGSLKGASNLQSTFTSGIADESLKKLVEQELIACGVYFETKFIVTADDTPNYWIGTNFHKTISHIVNFNSDTFDFDTKGVAYISSILENMKISVTVENDGIGGYEYWGQQCYDHGRNYGVVEGGTEEFELRIYGKYREEEEGFFIVKNLWEYVEANRSETAGVTEESDGFDVYCKAIPEGIETANHGSYFSIKFTTTFYEKDSDEVRGWDRAVNVEAKNIMETKSIMQEV
jgi:hypothetical protein